MSDPAAPHTFADTILAFFDTLTPPDELPPDAAVLWPFRDGEVRRVVNVFYRRFFDDTRRRIFLIGINPGRFGAGVTGLCFTDPKRLAAECGITHGLAGGTELSSDFVYRMIRAFGGPREFYRDFYLTALSPVGFTRNGKNLNYYDVKGLPERLDSWMARSMSAQIAAGCDTRVAFSMGQGENFRHLDEFNRRHGFFDRVEPLPHPRWVMQYRRRSLDGYIDTYVRTLRLLVSGRPADGAGPVAIP